MNHITKADFTDYKFTNHICGEHGHGTANKSIDCVVNILENSIQYVIKYGDETLPTEYQLQDALDVYNKLK